MARPLRGGHGGAASPQDQDDDDPDIDASAESDADSEGQRLQVRLQPDAAGSRLDRALASARPELSRARLQALMAQGQVSLAGVALFDASAKAMADVDYTIRVPAPAPAEPRPEAIVLDILFEDTHLIVVDKPAGMAAHPGPGTPDGTLVNALLHHCAGSLSGIGGVIRPGIVHRLDKNTSGVMVAAKTDAAHQGLSALFARHDIERLYIALTRGAPDPARGTIATQIGRAPWDRQKMAVLKSGGREAITRYATEQSFGAVSPGRGKASAPVAARVRCRLETGRTHQIRVHLASKGTPCLGDTLYGSGPPAKVVRDAMTSAGLTRQALHAAVLGFVHPVTGESLRFETDPPTDMTKLESDLATQLFSR